MFVRVQVAFGDRQDKLTGSMFTGTLSDVDVEFMLLGLTELEKRRFFERYADEVCRATAKAIRDTIRFKRKLATRE